MTMKLRLFTQWAADQMESTLIKKDALGYKEWEALSHQQRYENFMKEVVELMDEFRPDLTPEQAERLRAEATDVANTAMMLAGGFEPIIQDLARGRRPVVATKNNRFVKEVKRKLEKSWIDMIQER